MPLQEPEKSREIADELIKRYLSRKEELEKEEAREEKAREEKKFIDQLSKKIVKKMEKKFSFLEQEIKEIKDTLKTIVGAEEARVEKESQLLSGHSIFAIRPVVSVSSSEASTSRP